MQEELFADGIGEIHVTNNVVRIDFVSLSATERDATNNPKTVFRQRVVMPIEAFANSSELVNRAIESLARSGAIKKTLAAGRSVPRPENNEKPTSMSAVATSTADRSTVNFIPKSPNFAPA